MTTSTPEPYEGFEQGPIRPPSEAASLLLRVMRNCPWNRCTFCPLYKNHRFSRRPVEHVKRDIDAVYESIQAMREQSASGGRLSPDTFQSLKNLPSLDPGALRAASNWLRNGQRQVFLQDADALALEPEDLLEILKHLAEKFPSLKRVTCYSRSSTVARLAEETLVALREAGLSRVHIGMESGSDEVLRMVRKGATQALHIKAGQKLKSAGLELSEYYMPGLGGSFLWEKNATETAFAMNHINPDFIRIRTLALPSDAPLAAETEEGRFSPCPDDVMVQELQLFIEALSGITSQVQSDHIVNLLPEVAGDLPHDQGPMLNILRSYLSLDPERRTLYKVGRRLGFFSRLSDLDRPGHAAQVEAFCRQHEITSENVDAFTADLIRRYI